MYSRFSRFAPIVAKVAFRNGQRAQFSSASYKHVAAGVFASAAFAGSSFVFAEGSTDYAKVKADIVAYLEDNEDMGPTLVRLAWHSSGTYSKEDKTGGSEGATMRFNPEAGHGANAGLHLARDVMAKIGSKFPNMSNADLYTYAAVVAIEFMGGPTIPWRPGRTDAESGKDCTPDGRLPDAAQGAKHVRDIFYRMGFDDREITALVGAHAIGRCYPDRSGYSGPWTRAPTTFSNEFFRELLENKWTIKKWDGPEQYEDPTGDLMMLPADMAFLTDPEFRKYVELYAKDEELWFKDFSKAFQKLEELGVPAFNKGWFF